MKKLLLRTLDNIFHFYGNLRIRTKIMLNFFVVIILITVSVGWVYYYKAASMVENEITANMQGVLDQADINIQSIISSIEESSMRLYSNTQLRSIFLRDRSNYPVTQQFEDFKLLNEILISNLTNKNISSIQLYFANGAFYNREKTNFFSTNDAAEFEWYSETGARNGSILWLVNRNGSGADHVISCSRALVDYSVADGELGYINLEMKETTIADILLRIENSINGKVYLVNSNNYIVSAVNKELIKKPLEYSDQLKSLIESRMSSLSINKDGARHLLMTSCSNAEWRIVAEISLGEVQKRNTEIIGFIIIITSVVFLLAIIMALVLSASITTRIRRLATFMQNVDMNKSISIPVKYNDEISELEQNFNKMLMTASELIHENYTVRLSKKEAELRALQAQINPHFLYNVLDSINWMAMKYKAPDISKMSRLLGSFFRLSLSKGKNIVSVKDEIEHARVYVEIMQARFENDLNIVFEINEEILPLQTIKLVLQPVIENAIVHGIQGRPEQRGNITVKGIKSEDFILFSVMDDGIGIKPEILEKLPIGLESASTTGGYGVKNVHERIQLYFGENYGLTYKSMYGAGTTVEIRLPAKPNNT